MFCRCFSAVIIIFALLAQTQAKELEVIQVQDDAYRLAESMGGEKLLLAFFSSNRLGLIESLMATYKIDQTRATQVCDKYVMPALTSRSSDFVGSEANALRTKFSHQEIIELISIFQRPTVQKLVRLQASMQMQLSDFAATANRQVVKELFADHGPELHRLGVDR